MDVSEAELLVVAKTGDKAAFTRALMPYLPMLYAYSRGICADHHVAEDVVQQTALIAWRKLGYLFAEVDFGTWLRGIARREALSERRKTARWQALAAEIVEAAFDDPSTKAVSSERIALETCLKRLQGHSVKVVQAHYFDGEKLTDIARSLDLNFNTVRTILHRARLSLAECVRAALATGVE